MRTRSVTIHTGSAPVVKKKSFFGRLFGGFNLRTVPAWEYISGANSGGIGSEQRALQLSAVWRAVRLNAETVASLPINAYRWDENNGPQLVTDSPTLEVIKESPNADQTPMEFWEDMQGSLEMTGDAIAIKMKVNGRVVGLRWIDPRPPACVIERMPTGDLRYRVTEPNSSPRDYSNSDVFHIRGFSVGGIRGLSPIAVGAGSLGLAMNAQRAAQEVFVNGLRTAGFVKTNGILKEDDRKRIKEVLQEYMGSGNAGGIMLLEAGMDFTKMGINPIDAELMTTRKFEVEEIGRWFGVPPILLGHAVEGQTMWGSGVESIVESWLMLGLRQRLVRNQQAIAKRLRVESEKSDGIYFRYNPDALLAVLSNKRIEALTKATAGSLFKPNEARAVQDLPPVPGGDAMLAQVNLAPLTSLGENGGGSERIRSALKDWLKPDPGEV